MEPLGQPVREQKSFFVIWMEGDRAIGHSNINKIVFGQ